MHQHVGFDTQQCLVVFRCRNSALRRFQGVYVHIVWPVKKTFYAPKSHSFRTIQYNTIITMKLKLSWLPKSALTSISRSHVWPLKMRLKQVKLHGCSFRPGRASPSNIPRVCWNPRIMDMVLTQNSCDMILCIMKEHKFVQHQRLCCTVYNMVSFDDCRQCFK